MLLVPFTAFLAAEQAHASGTLAVVAAAFALSVNLTLDPKHQYPGAYRTRLQEEAFWPVVDFVLETFAGRPAIQAIALIVTLGTLLIQGTTIGRAARLLKFDLAGERAEEERMRELGREIVRTWICGRRPSTRRADRGRKGVSAGPNGQSACHSDEHR